MKQILGIVACILLFGCQPQDKAVNQPSAASESQVALKPIPDSPARAKVRSQGVPLGNILGICSEEVAGIEFYIMDSMAATPASMREDWLKEAVLNNSGNRLYAHYAVSEAQLADFFSDLAASTVLPYDTQDPYFDYRLLIEVKKKDGESIQFATTRSYNNGIMLATLIRGSKRINFEADLQDMVKLLQYAGRSDMLMDS